MPWKSTFATLTTLLLLTVSCVASACETSCDVMAVRGACHAAVVSVADTSHHTDPSMTGMADCGMSGKVGGALGRSTAKASSLSCSDRICERAPALLSDEDSFTTEQVATRAATVRDVVLLVDMFAAPSKAAAFKRLESPPPAVPRLISLQTILRI